MLKILTVIGARPQFVKAATVSRVVASKEDVSEIIVHTGQHYDANMSDVFFDELGIPRPDHHLGIGGGPHGQMTGRQLEAIEKVLLEEKPDFVLVYGDTNSTLAGALAAAKLHMPVAHVEAGLRSFNRKMPEEINRIMADHIADALFTPTETAMKNLRHEGIAEEKLHLVGDVMFDAALFYWDRGKRPDGLLDIIKDGESFILATVHRAENTDDRTRLSGILDGLSKTSVPVVLPLHPRTKSKLEAFDLSLPTNIHVIPPVSYLEMVWLEANCSAVATDSGGVQKEAYFFSKPCVTLRDETEWVELVQEGWNNLVGADAKLIADGLQNAKTPVTETALYGDGTSAEKVVNTLLK